LSYRYLFSQYRRYVNALESFISRSDADFPVPPAARAAFLATDELEVTTDVGHEDFHEAIEVFPEVLRRSCFLTLFTLLECRLAEHAAHVQQVTSNPILLHDLRGTGFGRVIRYLDRLGTVRPTEHAAWPEIHGLQLLRNCLVHSNGGIGPLVPDNAPLVQFIHSHATLALSPNDGGQVVSVRQGFCNDAVEIVESFVLAVCSSRPESPAA